MALLMNKSEFAKRRGVRPSAVSNWIKRDLIVFADDPARPGKRLVDAEKSDILVSASVDQTRGRPRSADVTQVEASDAEPASPHAALPAARPIQMGGTEAARLEDMRERTLGRRIENEKAMRNLVALADVERQAADRGRMIRERVQNVVRAQAERLAAETDPRVIASLLSAEFDQLFERIADEIERQDGEEAAADDMLARLPGLDEDADDDDQAVAA